LLRQELRNLAAVVAQLERLKPPGPVPTSEDVRLGAVTPEQYMSGQRYLKAKRVYEQKLAHQRAEETASTARDLRRAELGYPTGLEGTITGGTFSAPPTATNQFAAPPSPLPPWAKGLAKPTKGWEPKAAPGRLGFETPSVVEGAVSPPGIMGLEGTITGATPAEAPPVDEWPDAMKAAQDHYVVKKNDTLTDIATAHLSQGGKKPTKKEVWRQAAVWADSLNLEGKGKKLKTRGTDLKPGMKLPEVSADLETRPGVYMDLFGAPKKPPKKAVSDAGQVARSALEAAGPIGKTSKGPYGTEGFMPDPLPDTSKVVSAPLRELDVLPSRGIAPPAQVSAAPSPGRSARRELVPPGQD